jgi:hypothetical protein
LKRRDTGLVLENHDAKGLRGSYSMPGNVRLVLVAKGESPAFKPVSHSRTTELATQSTDEAEK